MESHWFDDFSNVLKLARHLIENGDLDTASEVLYYFEKPWKYDSEWEELNSA